MITENDVQSFQIKTFLLSDLKSEIGSEKVEKLISDFFCRLNPDVEYFLKYKAIPFSDTNKASTYLIIVFSKDENPFICAYFSIANKSFVFPDLSNTVKKRLVGHEEYRSKSHPTILIGQIGRNENATYKIEGKEIFKIIYEIIDQIVTSMSGIKLIYIDAFDNEKLIKKYEEYGFNCLSLINGEIDKTDDGLVKMVMTVDKMKTIFLK